MAITIGNTEYMPAIKDLKVSADTSSISNKAIEAQKK